MSRLIVGLLVALCGSVVLADESSKESALLKARIAQLESQLVQTEAARAVCEARVNQSLSVQVKQEIEKEAGCSIDWQVVPPRCKS